MAKKIQEHLTLKEITAGTLAAAAVVGFAVHEVNKTNEVSGPQPGEDYKVYTVGEKPGTVWQLAEKAFPNSDPRIVVPIIRGQLPKADQSSYTLRTGEQIVFNQNASIGEIEHPNNGPPKG